MLKYDIKEIKKLEEEFGVDIIQKAVVASINKTTAKTRTHISKSIRAVYNVNSAAVSSRLKFRRASRDSLSGELVYTGSKIGLINFKAKAKKVLLGRKPRKGKAGRRWGRERIGVTVKVLKKGPRRLVKSNPGFIAVGKNNNEQIFYRAGKGKDRNYLYSAKSLSISGMVSGAEGRSGDLEEYDKFAAREQVIEFDRAIQFYAGK